MKTGEVELTPERPRKFLGCGCAAWFLLGFVVFFIATTGVGMGYIETGWYLVGGWVSFLYRTLPRIAWNWDLIGMGVICSVGILLLAHQFLRWLVGSITAKRQAEVRWPWRWTWCGIAALGVLFLVGMAVGGAAHQIGWMTSSPEPLMERRPRMEMYDLRMVELALTMATQDETNAVAVRQLLWDRREQLVGSSKKTAEILQSHHVLLIAPSNIVRGWLIFPRNSGLLERLGGRMQRDEEFKQLKASEIHEEIERLKDILVPL